MNTNFQVISVSKDQLQAWLHLSVDERLAKGVQTCIVDAKPGYPCRLSLEDAELGEEVLLFTYQHHNVDSPYRASGPIFVCTSAQEAKLPVNSLPIMLQHRLLSVRAYDSNAMMVAAKTVEGQHLREAITAFFNKPNIAYLQVHNAGPGCFNCEIRRAT